MNQQRQISAGQDSAGFPGDQNRRMMSRRMGESPRGGICKKLLCQTGQRKGIESFVIRRRHGAVEGLEAAQLIKRQVEGGDIAESDKAFGIFPDRFQIQQRQNPGRAVSSPQTKDAFEFRAGEGPVQIPGALGVTSGKVAVGLGAAGQKYRPQLQRTDRIHTGMQTLPGNRRGGTDESHRVFLFQRGRTNQHKIHSFLPVYELLSLTRTRRIDNIDCVRYNVHEVRNMTITNVTNFRKNIFSMLEQTIKYNEPINISTKDGNAVVLSEEEYQGMLETIYLMSIPEMKEKLIEGKNTPLSECVSESEVDW